MKKYTRILSRSVQVALLPVLFATAGIYASDASAGGNATGQPSGTTIAGSSTTPPPAVSALTSILLGGSGPTVTTTTTTTGGVTTTTRSVTIPASSLSPSFAAVGLSLPGSGTTTQYASAAGIFTVTSQGGSVTVTYVTTL